MSHVPPTAGGRGPTPRPPFDPGHGTTAIYLGPADRPPTWDQQRNVVSNTTVQFRVDEKEFSRAELSAGRYWLWSSDGGDVVVVSCSDSGVGDAEPVAR